MVKANTRGSFNQRPRRFQQQTPERLLTLPLEVLTEVFRPLSWRDILSLRQVGLWLWSPSIYPLNDGLFQTCKYLSQATRAKPTWVDLFNASNAACLWPPLRLERPIELYTAPELEYLVVRRDTQETKRKARDALSPVLTRRLPVDNSQIKTLILIDGGRWLLTASGSGSVSYYNLGTRKPVQRLLIPKIRKKDGSSYDVNMVVDVDDESALLSFNLALYVDRGCSFFLFLIPFSRILLIMTRLQVKSNPNRSSVEGNSPTRWPKSRGESLGDASVLFPSWRLRFSGCYFPSWEVYRLRSYNDYRCISLYGYSWLGKSQQSKSVTPPHCIEVIISEENHSHWFFTSRGSKLIYLIYLVVNLS